MSVIIRLAVEYIPGRRRKLRVSPSARVQHIALEYPRDVLAAERMDHRAMSAIVNTKRFQEAMADVPGVRDVAPERRYRRIDIEGRWGES